jgi:membrane associated rhomboid family serine protease
MNSYGYGSSEEHQPLTWVRGHPIYAAHAIVAVLVLSMIATAICMWANASAILNFLPFRSESVLRGEIWRLFTYGFLNQPSIWFAIEMIMIVWFGRELEKFYGRRKFLTLYAGLYLIPPLVLTVFGLWQPNAIAGRSGSFGLFIGFATLYPNVAFFFNILAKWLAIILVALYTLMALSSRDTAGLIYLWTTIGFAHAFVRDQQGRFHLPSFRRSRGTPSRETPRIQEKSKAKDTRTPSTMAEVDALLDKIAQSGIGSLTAKERAKLDEARSEMKKRAQGQ